MLQRDSSIRKEAAMPEALESGTLNTPGIIGLGEGIAFIERT